MTKQRIIDNPSQWIITKRGDLVRIKDSEIRTDEKLEVIREHLKKPFRGKVRFTGKTPEQISKERYDKVWEEVNFDLEKLHDWIYDEKNKDKVEIIKLEGQDFQEAVEAIFNHVKSSKQKWREILEKGVSWDLQNWHTLINEETGQVIWPSAFVDKEYSKLCKDNEKITKKRKAIFIDKAKEQGNDNKTGNNKYNSVMIFLHGTYGAGDDHFSQIEKNFPNTKFIYPHSPILQYDMWHGLGPAPGGQCQGWINITGDAWELMETDLPKSYNNPHSPPTKKDFEEADKIIHLDYCQLMRAVNYVNQIIEMEIAAGIPPEKIFISGYSQGGLLTLAVALTSQHKLGGFIPLCGLLPRWDKLLVNPSTKNKETPCLIINNSGDPWVPFWTGKKSYDLLKEWGYNVEFKTHPGRGHGWENKDIEEFLKITFILNPLNNTTQGKETPNSWLPWILGGVGIAMLVAAMIIIHLQKESSKRNKKRKLFQQSA